ncbi:MAG TPA: 50S ribosomal protein L11 methyltransferase [Vicinamibacterales bacterium]|nr:50S ribosomal protein L11 methyltransferase [Vicinamibacterales bacterium]
MPYRVDVSHAPATAADTLIELGALDVEFEDGGVAALMPDTVSADAVGAALGRSRIRVSTAVGRDDQSVWTLRLRPVRVRSWHIVPADDPPGPDTIRLEDTPAFGTGLHATTALGLEAIDDLLGLHSGASTAEADLKVGLYASSPASPPPDRILDVGTGSGILALASLRHGVSGAVGLDLDRDALRAAIANARLNAAADRMSLVQGGPDAVRGCWPLVVANIRAADLMDMAPSLVRRVASGGRLVLSGIPDAVAADVELTYRRLGMKQVSVSSRDGWSALVLCPSW